MHSSMSMTYLVLSVLWLTETVAQEAPDESLRELLCEQCPFDAPVRPQIRREFVPREFTPNAPTMETDVDARLLEETEFNRQLREYAERINQQLRESNETGAPESEETESSPDEETTANEDADTSRTDE